MNYHLNILLIIIIIGFIVINDVIAKQQKTKKYFHQPIFGSMSILDRKKHIPVHRVHRNNDLGFINSKKMTVSIKNNNNNKKHLFIKFMDIPNPTTNDILILTCHDQPSWKLNEGFDAARVSKEAIKRKSMFLTNITILPDLRCQYIIRYVRIYDDNNNINEWTIVAEAPIKQTFGILPTQQHLSFTSNRDEMLIAWVSGHSVPAPTVKWGLKSKTYTSKITGTSNTYKNTDMCNAPANKTGPQHFINPGYIHQVTLTNLPLGGITIYYVVGNDKHGYSKETSFKSRLNETDTNVKFLMYADQAIPFPHIGPAWKLVSQVENDIVNNGYDAFLLHPGDLGYAEGSGVVWDLWSGLVEPVTKRIAYEVTIGNHEYDHTGYGGNDPSGAKPGGWHPQNEGEKWGNMGDDSQGECGVPTNARYFGTGNGNGIFWYSFDEGGVHSIVMSSEHDWRIGSKQYLWLENDLKSVDRTKINWIIISTHRMMYTAQLLEVGDYKVSLGLRENLEPLLRKYKVNLFLVGHQHSYERIAPVYNGTIVEKGTVHLTVGSAGATHEKGGFKNKSWSVKHVDDYGYIRLDANSSQIFIEFVRTNKHGNVSAGQVWDSVIIPRWG